MHFLSLPSQELVAIRRYKNRFIGKELISTYEHTHISDDTRDPDITAVRLHFSHKDNSIITLYNIFEEK